MISIRLIPLLSVALLLAACAEESGDHDGSFNDGDNASSTSMLALAPPQRIREARAVSPDDLRMDFHLDEVRYDGFTRNDDNQYVLALTLPPGSSHRLSVEWQQQFAEQLLVLARADMSFDVPRESEGTHSVVVRGSRYVYGYDADNDGYTNIKELEIGSNPLDIADPENPATNTELQMRFALPEAIAGAPPNLLEPLSLEVLVDGARVDTVAGDAEWSATAEVLEGGLPNIVATFYATPEQRVLLASASLTDVDTSVNPLVIPAGGYDVTEDADQDGYSNVEEWLAGAQPFDASDYPDNDAEAGNAAEVGTTPEGGTASSDTADFDNDGLPDAVDDDADGDGIVDLDDYFVDLDGNGEDDTSGLYSNQAQCHRLGGDNPIGTASNWRNNCELSTQTPGKTLYTLGAERILWCLEYDDLVHELAEFADGRFDRHTRNAVAAFQEDEGLDTNGRIDAPTWARLQSKLDSRWALAPASDVNAPTQAFRVAEGRCPGSTLFQAVLGTDSNGNVLPQTNDDIAVAEGKVVRWLLAEPIGTATTREFSMRNPNLFR